MKCIELTEKNYLLFQERFKMNDPTALKIFKDVLLIGDTTMELISELPFGCDDPREFIGHERYPTNRAAIPHWLTKVVNNLAKSIESTLGVNIYTDSNSTHADWLLINRYVKGDECSWHQDFHVDDERDEFFLDQPHLTPCRVVISLGPSKVFQTLSRKGIDGVRSHEMSHLDAVFITTSFDKDNVHQVEQSSLEDDQIRYTFMLTFGIKVKDLEEVTKKVTLVKLFPIPSKQEVAH